MVTMKKLLLRSFLLNIMCFLDEKFSKYKNSEGVRQKKNKINIKLELSYFLEYVVNKNRTATIQEVVLKVLIGTQVFFRCLAFRIFFFFFLENQQFDLAFILYFLRGSQIIFQQYPQLHNIGMNFKRRIKQSKVFVLMSTIPLFLLLW